MNDKSLENLTDISKRSDFKEITAKGGRNKKGSITIKSTLKKLLAGMDVDKNWSNPIIKKLLQKAMRDGDMRAVIEIMDRIEGKVSQAPLIDQSQNTNITYVWKTEGNNNPLRGSELSERDSSGR